MLDRIDAVIRDAMKDADALREDAASGRFGPRALKSRIGKINERRSSLLIFEDLFETHLVSVHTAFEEVEAALTVAMLAAEEDAP